MILLKVLDFQTQQKESTPRAAKDLLKTAKIMPVDVELGYLINE